MSFIGKNTNYLDFGAVKINRFPKTVPCTTNSTFCQPTEQTDDIEFQFEVSESTELITNGNFDSITGWTNVGWALAPLSLFPNREQRHVATTNVLSQVGILTENDFYRVTLTVSNYPGGTLIVGGGTGSNFSNQALNIQSNGTFTAFFEYTEVGGNGDFIIRGFNANSIGAQVDNVSVVKISTISDYTVQIIDVEDSSVLDTVDAANLRLDGNLMTVKFNWLNDLTVTNGCRAIRILDGTNIFEDNFVDNQGWDLGADVAISGGVMRFVDNGSACKAKVGFDCGADLDNIFSVGESYTITYTVLNVASASVAVFCGNTQGTIRTTNGTFVETLICTDITRLSVFFFGAFGNSVQVDNIFIKKENNIDGQSECYDLQTTHDCTLLFVWSNDEKWGVFNYSTPQTGSAFIQRLRLESKFRGSKYPSTRNIGEDSAGKKSMDYTSFRKSKILDIHRSPEYIHDAIASMFMQDNRTVGGDSYVLVDEYEPSSPNDSRVLFKDFMTARIELEPTDQPNQINRSAF